MDLQRLEVTSQWRRRFAAKVSQARFRARLNQEFHLLKLTILIRKGRL
jgi:hypothetical protein